jgi:hypothetical protein
MSPSGQNRASASQTSAPSYMNVDLSSDASPLSPLHKAYESSTSFKDEGTSEPQEGSRSRSYMNISPGQEKLETVAPAVKARPPALSILLQQQSDSEDGSRHCYANLEASDIEGLKKRYSATSIAEKLPAQTPPPLLNNTTAVREMSYAVLDLDKNVVSLSPGTVAVTIPAAVTVTTAAATSATTLTTSAATTTTTSMRRRQRRQQRRRQQRR